MILTLSTYWSKMASNRPALTLGARGFLARSGVFRLFPSAAREKKPLAPRVARPCIFANYFLSSNLVPLELNLWHKRLVFLLPPTSKPTQLWMGRESMAGLPTTVKFVGIHNNHLIKDNFLFWEQRPRSWTQLGSISAAFSSTHSGWVVTKPRTQHVDNNLWINQICG